MTLIPGAVAVQGLGYSPLLVALQGLVLTDAGAAAGQPRFVGMVVNAGSLLNRK